MGLPATLASGNLTVRPMTVSSTSSPKASTTRSSTSRECSVRESYIVARMYDSRTLHSREVLERVVDAFGDEVLETVIGRTVKFPDASVAGSPITQFAPEHPAAHAYRQLARELVFRGAVA